jgi:hypothetical protein
LLPAIPLNKCNWPIRNPEVLLTPGIVDGINMSIVRKRIRGKRTNTLTLKGQELI